MLSKNKIYKEFVEPHGTINFANWLTAEQHRYEHTNKKPDYSFDQWLNDKYEYGQNYWCADGDNKTWWDRNKEAVLTALGGLAGNLSGGGETTPAPEEDTTPPPAPPKSDKIIGLPKPVFYIGVIVLVSAVIYVGYRVLKPKNK